MALVRIPAPIEVNSTGRFTTTSSSTSTIDAAGESFATIGKVRIVGGGTKTISSAGGAILSRYAAVTFSNAGTTLRIGVQDVSANGVEDGTHDVYADLVGGTDTITGFATRRTAMEVGSKTISDGDLVAIVSEVISRGGADSITISAWSNTAIITETQIYPYRTYDGGAGPVKQVSAAAIGSYFLEFDDGTIGYIDGAIWVPGISGVTNIDFGSSSTPYDEYGVCVNVPYKCAVDSVNIMMGQIATSDSFDFVVYGDPLGSPSVLYTESIDPDYTGSTGNGVYRFNFDEIELTPGSWYAFALKPTTTNTIRISHYNMTSTYSEYKKPFPFGENIKLAGRVDGSGAFTQTEAFHLPIFSMNIIKIDDGKYVYPSGQIGMN